LSSPPASALSFSSEGTAEQMPALGRRRSSGNISAAAAKPSLSVSDVLTPNGVKFGPLSSASAPSAAGLSAQRPSLALLAHRRSTSQQLQPPVITLLQSPQSSQLSSPSASAATRPPPPPVSSLSIVLPSPSRRTSLSSSSSSSSSSLISSVPTRAVARAEDEEEADQPDSPLAAPPDFQTVDVAAA
jgi:hypothetical protein